MLLENKQEAVFFPLCVFSSFVKDQLAIAAWVCLGLLFWSTSLHVCFCANGMLFLLLWSLIEFKVGNCDTSSIGLFAHNCLAIRGLLCFHKSFKIDFSNSMKNVLGSLIGIALNI
jgi:hypothetical protein